MRTAALAVLFALLSGAALAQAPPSVVSGGPIGEIEALDQANEIRIAFSEPMVALGRIQPALAGRWRWSGTTTLIFTPDPGALRQATRYRVAVDAAATSARGQAP